MKLGISFGLYMPMEILLLSMIFHVFSRRKHVSGHDSGKREHSPTNNKGTRTFTQ